jgi:hypothetical protein
MTHTRQSLKRRIGEMEIAILYFELILLFVCVSVSIFCVNRFYIQYLINLTPLILEIFFVLP